MPKPVANQFTEFEFTKEEFYAATRMNQMQLMLLQTFIAQCAARRLAIKMRMQDNVEAVQEEICERGSQEAYEYLFMLATTLEAPEAGTEQESAEIKRNIEQQNPASSQSE